MNTIFNLQPFMNKIETLLFSSLFFVTLGLSIFGVITENVEAINASDEINLSKNKRGVEVVNTYYAPISNVIFKSA